MVAWKALLVFAELHCVDSGAANIESEMHQNVPTKCGDGCANEYGDECFEQLGAFPFIIFY